ncbi:cytidylyltransferase domain-containing protein [Motilimonas cestriensis]|uniref:acylneuraminate cytidylyltransferase family protein n=1 Tax=Motilimonas cestriensis TaxID=2742685 RepID=UPI003DA60EAE
MINGKRVLAVIPARGGSKRLPRKNVLPLAGKPLIAWSIDAAAKSKYIDNVIVSTDDKEIAAIAEQYGGSVPELRPEHLSTDHATTQSVLFHTLEKYGADAKIVVLLQPTSPLRTHNNIDEAIELFTEKSAFSVISVTPCEHPPLWANVLPESGSMENFIIENKRSQELGDYYRLNGAIYIYDVERMLNDGSMSYQEDSFAYKMENENSIDIDNSIDFDMAEFFFRRKSGLNDC